MTYSNPQVAGTGQTGDWVIIRINVDRPNFETVMLSNEDVFRDTMVLLALSGVDMDDEILDYARQTGMKFTEAAWNSTFSQFKNAVQKAPTESDQFTFELEEIDGKWKVDSFPDPGLF